MCLDLFGDVVVTVDDVNIWLDTVPKLRGESPSRRKYYAEYQDVTNKIKQSKLNGQFNLLIEQFKEMFETQDIDLFKTKYVDIANEQKACPNYFHICNEINCPIYIKREKKRTSKERYMKHKNKNQSNYS